MTARRVLAQCTAQEPSMVPAEVMPSPMQVTLSFSWLEKETEKADLEMVDEPSTAPGAIERNLKAERRWPYSLMEEARKEVEQPEAPATPIFHAPLTLARPYDSGKMKQGTYPFSPQHRLMADTSIPSRSSSLHDHHASPLSNHLDASTKVLGHLQGHPSATSTPTATSPYSSTPSSAVGSPAGTHYPQATRHPSIGPLSLGEAHPVYNGMTNMYGYGRGDTTNFEDPKTQSSNLLGQDEDDVGMDGEEITEDDFDFFGSEDISSSLPGIDTSHENVSRPDSTALEGRCQSGMAQENMGMRSPPGSMGNGSKASLAGEMEEVKSDPLEGGIGLGEPLRAGGPNGVVQSSGASSLESTSDILSTPVSSYPAPIHEGITKEPIDQVVLGKNAPMYRLTAASNEDIPGAQPLPESSRPIEFLDTSYRIREELYAPGKGIFAFPIKEKLSQSDLRLCRLTLLNDKKRSGGPLYDGDEKRSGPKRPYVIDGERETEDGMSDARESEDEETDEEDFSLPVPRWMSRSLARPRGALMSLSEMVEWNPAPRTFKELRDQSESHSASFKYGGRYMVRSRQPPPPALEDVGAVSVELEMLHEKSGISLSPTALPFWEALGLEPWSGAKDVVVSSLLFPVFHEGPGALTNDEALVQGQEMLRGIQSMYEMCHLGEHRPLKGPHKGVTLVSLTKDSQSVEKFALALQSEVTMLMSCKVELPKPRAIEEGRPTWMENPRYRVLYLQLPSMVSDTWDFREIDGLCRAFEKAKHAAYSQNPIVHDRLLLQILPPIMAPTSLFHSLDVRRRWRDIAMAVYQRGGVGLPCLKSSEKVEKRWYSAPLVIVRSKESFKDKRATLALPPPSSRTLSGKSQGPMASGADEEESPRQAHLTYALLPLTGELTDPSMTAVGGDGIKDTSLSSPDTDDPSLGSSSLRWTDGRRIGGIGEWESEGHMALFLPGSTGSGGNQPRPIPVNQGSVWILPLSTGTLYWDRCTLDSVSNGRMENEAKGGAFSCEVHLLASSGFTGSSHTGQVREMGKGLDGAAMTLRGAIAQLRALAYLPGPGVPSSSAIAPWTPVHLRILERIVSMRQAE
ncbi:hypothetical protein BJ684DRAFT_20394 [Piptocephalis cylindrospora]|uniref:Mediator of RNA polymerase II transcription subunit 13 n=1 Tax=Piptocephalis cylindrospora TaxID=1907219 RepID=A0A4P9Y2N3_9FUNG|nr:hypothetical protein BJ684DRAFT_20394 [Piptocephalis cylindrospora]|eukprot:RKP13095.1 hypothetical protein BJ684DRAFT_20394 [Piptocephalis cylindrospora]